MLKGKKILCISHTTWEGEYTKSTVQLLSLLARNNDVIFIEYPRTIKDLIYGVLGKIKAPVKQMLGISKRMTTIQSTRNSYITHVIAPPMLPTDFTSNPWIYKIVSSFNFIIYKRLLKKIAKKISLENLILITAYNPRFGLGVMGYLKEYAHIYYCYDGMDLNTHHLSQLAADEELCKRADAVITTSDYLRKGKIKYNPNTYVVKNGVDLSIFKQVRKTCNQGIQKRKIVGYVGSLDFRFDIDLIAYAATKLPDVIFEFTGHVSFPKIIASLNQFDNIRFKPPIAAHEVPNYLIRFDIGIVPYQLLEVNKNIYPLKINEYLAVGLPVVMTCFAELPEFDGFVEVSKTKDEFVSILKEQMEHCNKDKIQKRIAFANQNSWEQRAISFGNIIQSIIDDK